MEEFKSLILETIEKTINLDRTKINSKDSFEAYGIDSILSIEFISRLNKNLNITLKTTDLFNHPSVDQLAAYIASDFQKPLATNDKQLSFAKQPEPEFSFFEERLDYDSLFSNLLEDRKVQSVDNLEQESQSDILNTDIAVIGMSGRFPGADTIDEFFQNLLEGRCSISEFTRWDQAQFYDSTNKIPNKSNSKWGGFLKQTDTFDNSFFNISGKEAAYMDPQQRIFLEEAYKALLNAGYCEEMLDNYNCGVFAGCAPGEYKALLEEAGHDLGGYMFLGSSESILAARIAYYLNLKGPAISINTACSSSAVAIHQACESLISGGCEMAIAGGICVFSRPDFYLHTSKFHMLSPTGSCRPFDDQANGFVPAEGVGIIILKQLKKAVKDGDYIYGVIAGSGINQDGKTNGIMAPNSRSQEQLINRVYNKFQIDPEKIAFIEAHGTGTRLGDPIEVEALTNSFRQYTSGKEYCRLGSLKANIGHALTASGVIGVIRAIKSLQTRQLPPNINFETCNSHIDITSSPFFVNRKVESIREPGKDYAAVSSFGFSGVNAHIVLRADNRSQNPILTDNFASQLFVLSAKTKSALTKLVTSIQMWLQKEGADGNWRQALIQLQAGRSHFRHRIAFIVESYEQLCKTLSDPGVLDQEYYNDCNITSDQESSMSDQYVELIHRINQKFSSADRYQGELEGLRYLYLNGYPVNFRDLQANQNWNKVPLPGYEFDSIIYTSPVIKQADRPHSADLGGHPLLSKNISSFNSFGFLSLVNNDTDFVKDHVLNRQVILPAAIYLELIASGGTLLFERTVRRLRDIRFLKICELTSATAEIRVQYQQQQEDVHFDIVHHDTVLASGFISQDNTKKAAGRHWDFSEQWNHEVTGEAFYSRIRAAGYDYGKCYQTVSRIRHSDKYAEVILSGQQDYGFTDLFTFNPWLLDGIFQAGLVLIRPADLEMHQYVPSKIGDIYLLTEKLYAHRELRVLIHLTVDKQYHKEFYLEIFDDAEQLLAVIDHYCVFARQEDQPAEKEDAYDLHNNWEMHKSSGDKSEKEPLLNYLTVLLAEETKTPVEKIDGSTDLSVLGIDSIMILSLIEQLEQDFTDIPTTLFYEYKNIEEIASFLLMNHTAEVKRKFAIDVNQGEVVVDTEKLTMPENEQMYSVDNHEPIAIIGLAGRYPMAENLEIFWDNLIQQKDCITEIPKERWDYRNKFDSNKNAKGTIYSKWGGFIDDVDKFDSLKFQISPKEAKLMDPQERVFLENAWSTLEDAGYTKEGLKNQTVGVFVGVMYGQYQLIAAEETQKGNAVAASSFYAAIANRVSYFFDFKGPSMALDTMCSSSLTAIHLACGSILNGECELALAGGVNLNLHESKHLYLCQEKFASSDGRCRSFGIDGDGYVPGEGVGSVLLKRLSQAQRDGDHIYAVIKGTAINHGGRSNGYSVPDPTAQARVLKRAIDQAEIKTEDIDYLEMHGTGTALGDPIEIRGALKCFDPLTETGYRCPIGSVKSNIGHLESAAGIAGLTKILLQMKHQTLVPSLHSEETNPNINFEKTPFYLPKQPTPWDCGKKRKVAGLSAFGAGGSNAHMIVEEYPQPAYSEGYQPPEYLIVLSSDTKEILDSQVEMLIRHLKKYRSSLLSVAYTLQTGREEMNERLAVVATGTDDLVIKLSDYLKDKKNHKVYLGTKKKLPQQELNYKDFEDLAVKWCQGSMIKWQKLYEGRVVEKTSLPTYPFRKISHWINRSPSVSMTPALPREPGLHDLFESKQMGMNEHIYRSQFSGAEYFYQDHVVGKTAVLPGVVQLEMFRGATEGYCNQQIGVMKEISWKTMIDNSIKNLNTSVIPEAERLKCVIWENQQGQNKMIYSEASIYPSEDGRFEQIPDLSFIKNRCDQQLDKNVLYEWINNSGLHYGKRFQVINEIFSNATEALSNISIESASTFKKVIFLPELFDGILQTLSAFFIGDQECGIHLPYYISEIRYDLAKLREYRQNYYVYARKDKTNTYRAYLLDQEGTTIAEFSGIKTTVLMAPKSSEGVSFFRESWIPKKLHTNSMPGAAKWLVVNPEQYQERDIDLSDQQMSGIQAEYYRQDQLVEAIGEILHRGYEYPINILFFFKKPDYREGIWPLLDQSVFPVLELVKQVAALKPKNKIKINFIQERHSLPEYSVYTALDALIKVANHENKKITLKFIEADQINNLEMTDLYEEFTDSDHSMVSYRLKERYVKQVITGFDQADIKNITIEDNKSYVITGGFGKIGKLITSYLCSQAAIKVTLLGRKALTPEMEKQLQQLKGSGSEIQYLQCNISDPEELKIAFLCIHDTFGKVNGIIHSAGVIKDSLLINKSKQDFKSVIDPKVTGTYLLDQISRQEPLDFFIMFSSIAPLIGNIGQADYCFGNQFMNDFSIVRNQLVQQKQRNGVTISFNWPLWKDGGMEPPDSKRRLIRSETGFDLLETGEGINAFERILKLGKNSVIVFKGDEEVFTKKFIQGQPKQHVAAVRDQKQNKNKLIYLKHVISKELELNEDDLTEEQDLTEYGLNSIMMMDIIDQLKREFENVPDTLFFDYQTISEIADTLVYINPREDQIEAEVQQSVTAINPENNSINLAGQKQEQSKIDNSRHDSDDIAVIGLSGKYPGAENLEEFWDNLKNKKNCITEIPENRWNWNDYYDSEKGKKGKSYSKWGGFLKDIDQFDAFEFNITPKEARLIDPQERLFLETVLMAMDDAGYPRQKMKQYKVGVFTGAMYTHYQLLSSPQEGLSSSDLGSIANRVSYAMDFKGPSMTVDTMCSSSLTAIHLACQSIRSGECDMAVAGGVNLSIHPNKYLLLSQGLFLSTEGKCRSFGEGGDGYVPGEGVGAVILKPLQQAIYDHDNIYGVIKATGINHGGKTSGYSVPSTKAQTSLIQEVMEKSGVSASDISYIEAHGTGTALGDPIEIQALKNAYSSSNSMQPCTIGSLKSNIGHLEAAAGIASLTKVLLQFKYGLIAPSLYNERPNLKIDLKDSVFRLADTLQPWMNTGSGRQNKTAAISAFGAGGSNAHMIIQEWEKPFVEPADEDDSYIFVLSGRREQQLVIQVEQLLNTIADPGYEHMDYSQEMVAIISDVLQIGLTDHHYHQSFNELGIESADLYSIQQIVWQRFGVRLDINSLTDTMTIADLSGMLVGSNILKVSTKPSNQDERTILRNLSYTLWECREYREIKFAVTAGTIKELRGKLQKYLKEQSGSGIHINRMEKSSLSNCFKSDDTLNYLISNWAKQKEFEKIAEFWVNGLALEWNILYPHAHPNKITLPAFPLLRKSYWLKPSGTSSDGQPVDSCIDQIDLERSSMGAGLVLTKEWSSQDRVFSDHQVEGNQVLPGAVSVEMILEAISMVKKINVLDIYISELRWLRPIQCVDGKCRLAVTIEIRQKEISFVIEQLKNEDRNICVRGKAVERSGPEGAPVDLDRLQSGYSEQRSFEEIYEYLHNIGLTYGNSFKRLNKMYVAEDCSLGIVELQAQSEARNRYLAAPEIIDAAFQTISGIKEDCGLNIPSVMKGFTYYKSLEQTTFVQCKKISDGIYSIHLYDSTGALCIEIEELVLKPYHLPKQSAVDYLYQIKWRPEENLSSMIPETQVDVTGVFIYTRESLEAFPQLLEEPSFSRLRGFEISENNDHEWFRALTETLMGNEQKEISIYFASLFHQSGPSCIDLTFLDKAQEQTIYFWLKLVQVLVQQGFDDKVLNIRIITNNVYSLFGEEINPYYAYLHGFFKSLAKENPNWTIKIVDLDLNKNAPDKVLTLLAGGIPKQIKNDTVAIREGRYYTSELVHQPLVKTQVKPAFRTQGVYLIIGGAGGIGAELSVYLAEKYQAAIVLIGRKTNDENISALLKKIVQLGGQAEYLSGNVADLEFITDAKDMIVSKYGTINGVVHSAIVLKDKTIARMPEQDLRDVLTPKVTGMAVLGTVFQQENLDFFMVFSSAQAIAGSYGQGNYAGASTFKDSFANYLIQQFDIPVKIINWGYWGEVGIVSNKQYQRRLNRAGVYSISTSEGMEIIERFLSSGETQIIPVKADRSVLVSLGGRAVPEKNHLEDYLIINDKLEKAISSLVLNEFQAHGLFQKKHEKVTLDQLKSKIAIIPKYRRLFLELISILEQAAFIVNCGGFVITTSKVEKRTMISEFLDDQEQQVMEKELKLLTISLSQLFQILKGTSNATEVLFSNASVELVEGIYQGNVVVDHLNNQVAEYVKEHIRNKQVAGSKVKILEVGAGTGGTSKTVLEMLMKEPNQQFEYYYTDISNRFLEYGKKTFGAKYDFMKFQLLNIERDPIVQKFDEHRFDIIIATNVLHATQNINQTIAAIERLSASKATVIINEVVKKKNFLTLTFGLLDGWWLAQDEMRIPGTPLLSVEKWNHLLLKHHYQLSAKRDESCSQIPYQQVIAAVYKTMDFYAEQPDDEVNSQPATEIILSGQTTDNQDKEQIKNHIMESLEQVIEISREEIEIGRPFSEYGVDSISGLDLIKSLNDRLNIALKTTVIYDYPTVEQLSGFITEKASSVHQQ